MKPRIFALVALLPLVTARHARADDDAAAACADRAERAQVLRDETKLVESRELLVACAQRECPKAVRDSCVEWLADVERRVPSIVIRARDAAGRDVPNVRATLDGAPMPATIGATSARLNPGSHAIRYEAEGYTPVDDRVFLREGEGVRVIDVTFRSNAALVAPTSPPAGARRPILPYVLGGTAVVALGVFTVVGLSGVFEYRRLERDCAPGCASSELDGVRDRFLVADVALVVGAVALGGAVVSLLVSSGKPSHAATR